MYKDFCFGERRKNIVNIKAKNAAESLPVAIFIDAEQVVQLLARPAYIFDLQS